MTQRGYLETAGQAYRDGAGSISRDRP
jgi:hypothetical protein